MWKVLLLLMNPQWIITNLQFSFVVKCLLIYFGSWCCSRTRHCKHNCNISSCDKVNMQTKVVYLHIRLSFQPWFALHKSSYPVACYLFLWPHTLGLAGPYSTCLSVCYYEPDIGCHCNNTKQGATILLRLSTNTIWLGLGKKIVV